ncbi:tail fiber assembly protein [Salmonella enterica]|uniref:tail fiber assembly protein n=1 Tax=Citrobacter freundii TaxID=546 RepID=UPI001414BD3A|nr:tail fiber assembly protein [Citrobacter freundii]EAZ5991694.1 tail fiber assembly protein [Salmonella enterica]EBY2261614.1 tail fiber assembly protein [Salmonella enterica subsp. enterica serovar Newport]EBJ0730121.1 tail fiber assembly protein [Salmonella enterica]ECO6783100.1 tail fiber assembly protein [Salmonella enterica]ECO7517314.1 tail fiber assembly protein [Salmonella enterica]
MSQYYYSAAERGFYFADDKEAYEAGKGWPSDAIPVSDEDYAALFEGQLSGGLIEPGKGGYPLLRARPAPTKEDLHKQAEAQKQNLLQFANTKISTFQDAVDLDIAIDSEKTLLTEWKKYRVLLNRIRPEDAPKIEWPEIPA